MITGRTAQDTWAANGGELVPVDRLGDDSLDPAFARHDFPHLLVYSGYTYERLQRMARARPSIAAVLAEVDVVIDGPFVVSLAPGAGPRIGSANQRVIDLAATRRAGALRLWSEIIAASQVPPLSIP